MPDGESATEDRDYEVGTPEEYSLTWPTKYCMPGLDAAATLVLSAAVATVAASLF